MTTLPTNNELSSLEPELGLVESLKWVGLEGNPLRSLRRELAAGPCSELLKFLRTRLAEEAALAAEPWDHASAFDSHVREAAATGVLELIPAMQAWGRVPVGGEGYHWAPPGTPPPPMAASQASPKC